MKKQCILTAMAIFYIFSFSQVLAKDVEVFIGGKKFSSIEDYRQYRRDQYENKKNIEDFQVDQDDVVFQDPEAIFDRQTGVVYDPTKMKTIKIGESYLQDVVVEKEQAESSEELTLDPAVKEKLKAVSVNQEVSQALDGFASAMQNSVSSSNPMLPKQDALRMAIEQNVQGSGPILIISDENKLKIMQMSEPEEVKE